MNEDIWISLIRRVAYARNDYCKDKEIRILKIEGDKINFSFRGLKHATLFTSKEFLLNFEDHYFN